MSSFVRVEKGSSVHINNCRFEGDDNSTFVSCDNTSKVYMKENKFNNGNNNEKILKVHKKQNPRGLNSKCLCGSNRKVKDCCLKVLEKLNINQSNNICLVIGNGFNISARNHLKNIGEELNIDTSDFFNWKFKSISSNEKLIDDFPILKRNLGQVGFGKSFEKVQELNNYANSLIQSDYKYEEANILICELKYYIDIAFSYFQMEFDKKDISQWVWIKVLKLIKDKLSYIVSFNYELVLETALDNADISYKRVGLSEEKHGIGILKPHGSIDFDIRGVDTPLTIPINSYKDRNNMPIKKIKKSNLISRRCECDIILPLEESYQKDYQWIKPGYNELNRYGDKIDNLIICGMSYWECDRAEIDYILDSINKDAFITIVNKSVNDELMEKIYLRFNKEKVQIIDLDTFISENKK